MLSCAKMSSSSGEWELLDDQVDIKGELPGAEDSAEDASQCERSSIARIENLIKLAEEPAAVPQDEGLLSPAPTANETPQLEPTPAVDASSTRLKNLPSRSIIVPALVVALLISSAQCLG